MPKPSRREEVWVVLVEDEGVEGPALAVLPNPLGDDPAMLSMLLVTSDPTNVALIWAIGRKAAEQTGARHTLAKFSAREDVEVAE